MAQAHSRIRTHLVPLLVIAAAVAGVLITPPRAWVERVYSNHGYAFLQPRVTWLSDLFPFALSDLVPIACVALVLVWIVLAIARPRTHAWALFRRVGVLAASLVLIAGLVAGLSFRKQSLRETGDFRRDRVQHDAVLELAQRAVRELNAGYPQLPKDGPDWTEVRSQLAPAFEQARLVIGTPWKPRLARQGRDRVQ